MKLRDGIKLNRRPTVDGFHLIKDQDAKERLRMRLESYPRIYLGLLRLNRIGTRQRRLIVTKQTEIVIDGFPRSANSFAKAAFMRTQPNWKEIHLATHSHSPAQIVQAAKWNIPTMVLLREPLGAIRGYLAFLLEEKTITNFNEGDVKRVAERYCWFYETLLPYRDRIFIARFDDVTTDYVAVTERFIKRYSGPWKAYDPVELPAEKIFSMRGHIGPGEDRERIKREVEKVMTKWLDPQLLERAMRIYEKMGKD